MEDIIIKYLNELGSPLEKGYGCKLIVLEEKDFKDFAKNIVESLIIDCEKN